MDLLREYIRTILEKTDVDTTSFMIAAYPSRQTIQHILALRDQMDVPDGARLMEPEEMHCTLRWWEEHEECLEDVLGFLKAVNLPSVSCVGSGVKVLGESAVIMMAGCPQMHRAFAVVDQGVQKAGCPPSTFPNFKPHVTLYNGADEVEKLPVNFELEFDRYQLVDGNDKVYWRS